jgi:DUF1365 family protein
VFFARPLVTSQVIALIHWEARRLTRKGARLTPPACRSRERHQTGLANGEHHDYTGAALSAAERGPR